MKRDRSSCGGESLDCRETCQRFPDCVEDFAFSHDPEFVRSLDEADDRLRAGEVGTADDLERELLTSGRSAAVDDPAWVLARYEEAKELVSDLRDDLSYGKASMDADIAERVEDFWLTTFMDRCTTMGLDCGCNERTPK